MFLQLYQARAVGKKQSGTCRKDNAFFLRHAADAVGILGQQHAVITRHVVQPIFLGLFVDMVMTALAGRGMRHQNELAVSHGFQKIIDIFFFDMLNHFLAIHKIDGANERPMRQVHLDRGVQGLLAVVRKAIDGDDLSTFAEEVIRGVPKPRSDIENGGNAETIHQIIHARFENVLGSPCGAFLPRCGAVWSSIHAGRLTTATSK